MAGLQFFYPQVSRRKDVIRDRLCNTSTGSNTPTGTAYNIAVIQ